ncbi:hypothetical protein [Acetobacter malorum]|uniref:hypothetical protein n=1 Tax=Acetobacter malorum TaxID=178901 RepID=UPI0009ED6715|nr:hypothetical protein [Acetobacter malorum]
MAIGSVVQKGNFVYVYNEKGQQLSCIATGNKSIDGLRGYTISTVSIKKGNFIYIYDERGRQKSCVSAR